MDIYVVVGHESYVRDEILNIFSTKDKAEEYLANIPQSYAYSEHRILRWAVDNPKANYNGEEVLGLI